jgi:hypothetical protein
MAICADKLPADVMKMLIAHEVAHVLFRSNPSNLDAIRHLSAGRQERREHSYVYQTLESWGIDENEFDFWWESKEAKELNDEIDAIFKEAG